MEILKITGQNEDANGVWNRDDVEKDMRDLGYQNHNWIDFVLDHAFDPCLNQNIQNSIACLYEIGKFVAWSGYVDRDLVRIEVENI